MEIIQAESRSFVVQVRLYDNTFHGFLSDMGTTFGECEMCCSGRALANLHATVSERRFLPADIHVFAPICGRTSSWLLALSVRASTSCWGVGGERSNMIANQPRIKMNPSNARAKRRICRGKTSPVALYRKSSHLGTIRNPRPAGSKHETQHEALRDDVGLHLRGCSIKVASRIPYLQAPYPFQPPGLLSLDVSYPFRSPIHLEKLSASTSS